MWMTDDGGGHTDQKLTEPSQLREEGEMACYFICWESNERN